MRNTRDLLRVSCLSAACAAMSFGVSHPIAQSAGGPNAEPGRMLRPRLLVHVVADLEKTLAFYREGVGFTVASPPEPLTSSTLLHVVELIE